MKKDKQTKTKKRQAKKHEYGKKDSVHDKKKKYRRASYMLGPTVPSGSLLNEAVYELHK